MLKVINLLVGLRRLPPLSELTGEEERLLFELKSLYDEQGFLSVSDAYDLISGKSATTSYRNLMIRGLFQSVLMAQMGASVPSILPAMLRTFLRFSDNSPPPPREGFQVYEMD